MMNKIGLYIHIPFCHKICSYCDFCKRVSSDLIKQKYLNYLFKEIDLYTSRFNFQNIDTIYIGGGTPSELGIDLLDQLLSKVKSLNISFREYTIEINPEDLNYELVDLLVKYGVNRVSIGIQTLSRHLLKIINRDFNFERFKEAYNYLKKQIPNINIDLMYAIPNQTLLDLESTVKEIIDLNPTHLSIYSLILEDKTILKKQIEDGILSKIDEDLECQMIDLIHKLIFPKYRQYEVSNYCFDSEFDYRSIHNLKYWLNEQYLGVGLNASSYVERRFKNVYDLKTYFSLLDKDILPIDEKEIEEISIIDQKKYEIILGFRLTNGINLKQYEDKYQSSIFTDFPKINELIEKELLINNNGQLFINPKYFNIMNSILVQII